MTIDSNSYNSFWVNLNPTVRLILIACSFGFLSLWLGLYGTHDTVSMDNWQRAAIAGAIVSGVVGVFVLCKAILDLCVKSFIPFRIRYASSSSALDGYAHIHAIGNACEFYVIVRARTPVKIAWVNASFLRKNGKIPFRYTHINIGDVPKGFIKDVEDNIESKTGKRNDLQYPVGNSKPLSGSLFTGGQITRYQIELYDVPTDWKGKLSIQFGIETSSGIEERAIRTPFKTGPLKSEDMGKKLVLV